MGVDPFLLFFVELIFMGWGLALVWFYLDNCISWMDGTGCLVMCD